MFYKSLDIPGNTRETIRTFLGYNHNCQIEDGEFYDMRNLTSDGFPALSPRAERNCILSLKSSDWQTIEAEVTGRYEGQLSEARVVYSTGMILTEERETYAVTFSMDEELVGNGKVTVRFCAGEKNVGENTEVSDGQEVRFLVPEGADAFQVEVQAVPVDVETFREEDVAEAVTDIAIRLYNRNIRGMLLKDGKLAYMVGSTLYYDGNTYDFKEFLPADDDYRTQQQLVSFGAYILIFPLGFYLNTQNIEEYGTLAAEYLAGGRETSVKFTLSDANGKEITASKTKPESPENGDYWLDTSGEKAGLYRWSEGTGMWVSVSSTYIRISMEFTGQATGGEAFPQMFREGDAVFMDSGIDDIDNGSIIVKLGNTKGDSGEVTGGYILVKGILDKQVTKSVSAENPMYFRRKIPKMDYVCVSNNRVWGCFAGQIEDSAAVNEIYASKLGDAKNWYCYEGAATDSYTLSLGDDGGFTGAFTYQGYPMFFKENVVYKVYGGYPAAYQLYTYNCRGVQQGSFRSLAVVNEYLMYKSVQDVCVFDGSTPTGVSRPLGNEKYYGAAAGASLGKYYISMHGEDGEPVFFVYDMEYGIWHKEDDLELEEFAYNNSGELYGRNKISVYGFGNARNIFGQQEQEPEGKVRWMAETGFWGTDYLEKKYVKALHVRASIDLRSAVDVFLSVNEEEWKKVWTLRGDGRVSVYRIPIIAGRNDSWRIRLEGYGPCRIYAITKEFERGSDRG